MRALSLVHEADAGPGVFAEQILAEGVELDAWDLAAADAPPRDPADYDAVFTYGGAMHVDQHDQHPWIAPELALLRDLIDRGTPVLGACLGAQLLCVAAGGEVRRMPSPEIGWTEVELTDPGRADPVMGPAGSPFTGFQWHSYECVPPPGAEVLARNEACVQAFRVGSAIGIQFHAEVTAQDAATWIRNWRDDEDAVRIGLDHEALAAETVEKIERWNDFGRALCGRFLGSVAARPV